MHDSGFSFSHLESHAPGAVLAPGRHYLGGWVMPAPGGHFVDVRARVGDQVFPGIHGFPRADLAAHFRTGRPLALAEFKIAVRLAPGPAEIALEVLDLEGRWAEFQRVSFTVAADLPPCDAAAPAGPPIGWHEYGRALAWLLRAAARQPDQSLAELAAALAAEIPGPRDLRHPHHPFHGHLDEPAALARSIFGRVAVLGYLFHETQEIRRVLATFDLQVWQAVEHGRPSPGPAGYYPAFPAAAHCGLYGVIDAPSQLPHPASCRLYAELADGSLHLCSVQRSRLVSQEDDKTPWPPRDRIRFADARAALDAALAAHGLPVTRDALLAEEIARIEATFTREAPPTLAPVVPVAVSSVVPAAPLPRRALLVSHNLNHEGAPLFLLDYARHLAGRGVALTVLSPVDGPLRERFAALGARVTVVDADPVFVARTAGEARAALAALGRACDFRPFDLVVANTFTTFWAVHAAHAAGRPVLLYVHESTTPANFYLSRVAPAVVALAEEAFGLTDAVAFTTARTRGYHTGYGRPDRHHVIPGWIDVARLDAWRAAHPRADLRAALGIRDGELLVANIGTVCDRKGQHIFARAVDLLWRRDPELAARTRCVMLGGGDTPFDAALADLLQHVDRPNLEVRPATADYLPYYAAADLFVCSTYEESSPRVILEAMALGTPLLSSDVQGVSEQVRPAREATLVPAGDSVALAEGIACLLRSPAIGADLAQRARARVVAEFDAAVLLPRHAALAAAVAAGGHRP